MLMAYVLYFICGALFGGVVILLLGSANIITSYYVMVAVVVILGLFALLLGRFIHNASDRPIGE